MKDIQRKELVRCLKFIEALGCEYKIIAEDGEEFGTLEVKVNNKSRSPRRYPYGAVSSWYRQQLNLNTEVGCVMEINRGVYDGETIRSGVCSDLTKAWGKDTYTTNIVGDVVEVLRTA